MRRIICLLLGILLFSCTSAEKSKGPKEASKYTKAKQQEVLKSLPFENTQDFEDAQRGFIGNSEGSMSFEFIEQGKESPDTVNPSLWRQARLNNISGLFEVVPGIYQVRGFDLSNITFIKGKTGWIVVDPLTTRESAQKAAALFRKYQGDAPVTGIIFTHSHVDHFGGVRGLGENISEGIEIVAPQHFLEEALSENILAGNAMSRRASYMYGSLLPRSTKGTVDAGLGKGVPQGIPGILKPTKIIDSDYQKYILDGVEFEFLMAANTEAPAEFMFYIPQYKAACGAEVVNHTLHNLSTLRGAKTRNALLWTEAVKKSSDFLQNRTDVLFGSHHWPVWGQENIDVFLTKHGDLYRYIHDQTLRLANMGYTLLEIPEKIVLPKTLGEEFYNRGYYGSLNHNVKAVYDFYFGGWWDGNPAHLHKYPPEEAAKRYVKFMGGENKVIRMAQKSYDEGDYRWVVEVLNHVIFANPDNMRARNLSADAMEQLGYQAESAVWRAYYLTGALELRSGVVKAAVPETTSPDIIYLMPVENFLDYLAVKLNPQKAEGKVLKMNLSVDGVWYTVVIENSVLKHAKGKSSEQDFTVSMTKKGLIGAIFGKADLEKTSENSEIETDNKEQFLNFLGLFDTFEYWFNIVLP